MNPSRASMTMGPALCISSYFAATALEVVARSIATALIDSFRMNGASVKELPLVLVPFAICARLPHQRVLLRPPKAATDRKRHQSATNAHEVAHAISTGAEVVMANATTVGAPTTAEILDIPAELTVSTSEAAVHAHLHRRWGCHDVDMCRSLRSPTVNEELQCSRWKAEAVNRTA